MAGKCNIDSVNRGINTGYTRVNLTMRRLNSGKTRVELALREVPIRRIFDLYIHWPHYPTGNFGQCAHFEVYEGETWQDLFDRKNYSEIPFRDIDQDWPNSYMKLVKSEEDDIVRAMLVYSSSSHTSYDGETIQSQWMKNEHGWYLQRDRETAVAHWGDLIEDTIAQNGLYDLPEGEIYQVYAAYGPNLDT